MRLRPILQGSRAHRPGEGQNSPKFADMKIRQFGFFAPLRGDLSRRRENGIPKTALEVPHFFWHENGHTPVNKGLSGNFHFALSENPLPVCN